MLVFLFQLLSPLDKMCLPTFSDDKSKYCIESIAVFGSGVGMEEEKELKKLNINKNLKEEETFQIGNGENGYKQGSTF